MTIIKDSKDNSVTLDLLLSLFINEDVSLLGMLRGQFQIEVDDSLF
ncbi:hypothetical protein bpSLO_001492 (plasmid) [Borrelia parkeri]|nr:hypothetical protein [Borrelia parkeri]UPA11616.1 hypothetical protein bpSLO_001492 [Borrelia parkeri]